MLPIKKIYVDTRFMNLNSKSSSDFTIDLPQSYTFPDNTVAYIDDVCIPVSWYTIQEGRNNYLYIRVNGVIRTVEIAEGIYNIESLNDAIVDELNIHFGDIFRAEPDYKTNKIKISCVATVVYEILTDAQLTSLRVTNAIRKSEPFNSINNVLRNFTQKENYKDTDYVSGYIDLNPIRNLHLSSSNFGNFNTTSITGDSSIIKKIPVNANYNELLFNNVVLGSDYIDCSRQTLRQLSFRLQDVFGNPINLNGNRWSFSILFCRNDNKE